MTSTTGTAASTATNGSSSRISGRRYHDDCHWDFLNQGDDGKQGCIESFTSDPYFTATPFALPSPAGRSVGRHFEGVPN
jgi:hypothetical protein